MPEPVPRWRALLAGIDLSSVLGLEVGALAFPTVPPGMGEVRYADYADATTLRAKYAADPGVDVARIVEVDYLWSGQTGLRDIVGGTRFGYVVASHVVEHVPDLLGWLSELGGVLDDGGEIRLAVPDKRFTFDYLRDESRVAQVLDAHLQGRRMPSAQAMLDMLLNYVEVDRFAAWRGERPAPQRKQVPHPAHWLNTARQLVQQTVYHDVHVWVFTPASFAQLMSDLVEFDVLNLGCSMFNDTAEGCLDFLVGLRAMPDKEAAMASWHGMRARAAPPPWERAA